jgi:hypothetical protein
MICLSNESKGCSDVKRLLAIVGVSFNVIQPHLETVDMMKEMALPFIMTMLLNSYPRVRRYVAEQLFAKLSVDGDALFDDHGCLEEANQLLLSVVWHDEHDPCGTITEARNRIADLLNIALTKEERNRKIGKRASRSVQDEFESYSALVNASS